MQREYASVKDDFFAGAAAIIGKTNMQRLMNIPYKMSH
jgi:hypothetical protein